MSRASESAAKKIAPTLASTSAGAARWIVVPAVIRRMLPGKPIRAAAPTASGTFGALKSAKYAAALASWVTVRSSRVPKRRAAY
jgi:hypothetical protein